MSPRRRLASELSANDLLAGAYDPRAVDDAIRHALSSPAWARQINYDGDESRIEIAVKKGFQLAGRDSLLQSLAPAALRTPGPYRPSPWLDKQFLRIESESDRRAAYAAYDARFRQRLRRAWFWFLGLASLGFLSRIVREAGVGLGPGSF